MSSPRDGFAAGRATYRLQFHRGFTFRDARALIPYFAELGISHLYASPIMEARPGIGVAEIARHHHSGTPSMTIGDAQVWRKVWNDAAGSILAARQASDRGRC